MRMKHSPGDFNLRIFISRSCLSDLQNLDYYRTSAATLLSSTKSLTRVVWKYTLLCFAFLPLCSTNSSAQFKPFTIESSRVIPSFTYIGAYHVVDSPLCSILEPCLVPLG